MHWCFRRAPGACDLFRALCLSPELGLGSPRSSFALWVLFATCQHPTPRACCRFGWLTRRARRIPTAATATGPRFSRPHHFGDCRRPAVPKCCTAPAPARAPGHLRDGTLDTCSCPRLGRGTGCSNCPASTSGTSGTSSRRCRAPARCAMHRNCTRRPPRLLARPRLTKQRRSQRELVVTHAKKPKQQGKKLRKKLPLEQRIVIGALACLPHRALPTLPGACRAPC